MVDPPVWDPVLYARRHHVENLFSRLKDFARITLRRDKTRRSWMGFAHLAASGDADSDQVVAYDLAHAAAAVETGRALLDYGAKGDVEARITDRTKAVCAMHYAGYPAAVDRLRELCDARGIALVEDTAHAPSARRRCGCISSNQRFTLG